MSARAWSLVLAMFLAASSVAAASPLKVDQILQRHLEARGGREPINRWHSMTATGTMYRFGRSYDLEWNLQREGRSAIRYWGANEHILQIPGSFEVRQVTEADKAWSEIDDHAKGTTTEGSLYPWVEIPLRHAADFPGPAARTESGATWSLLGTEVIEEEELYRLDLRVGETRETWWITTDTFELRHRRAFFVRWGSERMATMTYLDYIRVEGLSVPATILIDSASATIEWSLEEIEVVQLAGSDGRAVQSSARADEGSL